jgi:hypothetical protein
VNVLAPLRTSVGYSDAVLSNWNHFYDKMRTKKIRGDLSTYPLPFAGYPFYRPDENDTERNRWRHDGGDPIMSVELHRLMTSHFGDEWFSLVDEEKGNGLSWYDGLVVHEFGKNEPVTPFSLTATFCTANAADLVGSLGSYGYGVRSGRNKVGPLAFFAAHWGAPYAMFFGAFTTQISHLDKKIIDSLGDCWLTLAIIYGLQHAMTARDKTDNFDEWMLSFAGIDFEALVPYFRAGITDSTIVKNAIEHCIDADLVTSMR